MAKMGLGSGLAAAFLALCTHTSQAVVFELQADSRVEECRNIQDMINYYSNLQNKGATPKVMKGWDRFRTKYEDKYEARQCTQIGASRHS